MVYGCETRIPGDLITETASGEANQADLLDQLSFFNSFRKERAATRKIFVPQDLLTCKQVWLRADTPKSLQPPYSGPYEVIDHSSDIKTSILKVDYDKKSISVVRLKRAFILNDITP